jgi:hypothetical protein
MPSHYSIFLWIEFEEYIDNSDVENEVMETMRDNDYLSDAETEIHSDSFI